MHQLDTIMRFLPRPLQMVIRNIVQVRITEAIDVTDLYPIKTCLVRLNTLSSKSIRLNRDTYDPVCAYKSGLILTPNENDNWCYNVRKLTSVKHKNLLLKIAHGDIYTKERKFRFGLSDSPNCARCGQTEDLRHKFYECDYVSRIWSKINNYIIQLRISNVTPEPENKMLGAFPDTNPTILTIVAETLNRISQFKDSDTFLRCPKSLAKNIVNHVIVTDQNEEIKNSLKDILI